jgi:hypothetical protein
LDVYFACLILDVFILDVFFLDVFFLDVFILDVLILDVFILDVFILDVYFGCLFWIQKCMYMHEFICTQALPEGAYAHTLMYVCTYTHAYAC